MEKPAGELSTSKLAPSAEQVDHFKQALSIFSSSAKESGKSLGSFQRSNINPPPLKQTTVTPAPPGRLFFIYMFKVFKTLSFYKFWLVIV